MNKSVMWGLVVALFTVFGVAGAANANIYCSDDLLLESNAVISSIENNKDGFLKTNRNWKMDYDRMLAKAGVALAKVQSNPPKYSDAADKWDQIADKAYDLANAAKQKLDSDDAGKIIATAEEAIRCATKLQ